jgi:hypothetical protein
MNKKSKSKDIISFYSLFYNNNEPNIFFLKEIEIEIQPLIINKSQNENNLNNDINYQLLLYNSSFYNKTVYEVDYLINYSLSVNYEKINGVSEEKEEIEKIKNEINNFKLSYKLHNYEKYYINNFSNLDFYLINKPIINFHFEQLSTQNNYYCLINNKYVIYSSNEKISNNEYVIKCIINFPWIYNYVYPSKMKICIYNNITALIHEKINLYDCKYISFLDDSFFIPSHEINFNSSKNIISFNSNHIINIYNIINSYSYNTI